MGIYDELDKLNATNTPAGKRSPVSPNAPGRKRKTRTKKRSIDRSTDRPVSPTARVTAKTAVTAAPIERGQAAKAAAPTHIAHQSTGGSLLARVTNSEQVVKPRRQTSRYSFEIFTDQKAHLRSLAHRIEEATGEPVAISEIIREAIDLHVQQLEIRLGDPPDNT